jgi:hypothetical protein
LVLAFNPSQNVSLFKVFGEKNDVGIWVNRRSGERLFFFAVAKRPADAWLWRIRRSFSEGGLH